MNERISAQACQLIEELTDVPASRCYLVFTNVEATHWGNDGGLFG